MQSNVATPKDIEMGEVEVGDIVRVTYVEPNDPENPDSSATEITIKGKVQRMNAAGLPMIHLRSQKSQEDSRYRSGAAGTELTLGSAHTLKPHLVTLLDRPAKPFKLEDRNYYTGRTDGADFKYRWTVKDGRVVFCEHTLNNERWVTMITDISDHHDDFLTKAVLGTHEFHEVIDPIPMVLVPGVTYEAKSRNTKKAQTIRFDSNTEWETFVVVDPKEVLTGVGRWEYPVEYINPRQAVINRAKSLGVKPENIYGGYCREKYGVDAEGYTLYSSYNHGSNLQWDLHRIQDDPMKVLEGIERGYLIRERP